MKNMQRFYRQLTTTRPKQLHPVTDRWYPLAAWCPRLLAEFPPAPTLCHYSSPPSVPKKSCANRVGSAPAWEEFRLEDSSPSFNPFYFSYPLNIWKIYIKTWSQKTELVPVPHLCSWGATSAWHSDRGFNKWSLSTMNRRSRAQIGLGVHRPWWEAPLVIIFPGNGLGFFVTICNHLCTRSIYPVQSLRSGDVTVDYINPSVLPPKSHFDPTNHLL